MRCGSRAARQRPNDKPAPSRRARLPSRAQTSIRLPGRPDGDARTGLAGSRERHALDHCAARSKRCKLNLRPDSGAHHEGSDYWHRGHRVDSNRRSLRAGQVLRSMGKRARHISLRGAVQLYGDGLRPAGLHRRRSAISVQKGRRFRHWNSSCDWCQEHRVCHQARLGSSFGLDAGLRRDNHVRGIAQRGEMDTGRQQRIGLRHWTRQAQALIVRASHGFARRPT